MQLIQPFNPMNYDPTQGIGQLPIGKHPVIIESDEVKPTKNNDGGYLQLNLRIIDGPNAGTTGGYRLNLYNNSQQAVEIAHKQLSAVCHVVGVFQILNDCSVLHNKPFLVEVGPQKGDPNYTEIKKVFDINGNEPGKAGQGTQGAQPQQQQGATGGGWQQGGGNQQQGGGSPQWGGGNQPQGGAGGGWQQPNQQQNQQPNQQQPQGGNQGGWQQNQQGGNNGAPPWGAK